MTKYTDEQAAKAIVAVLPDSRWVGAGLAQAYLWAIEGSKAPDDIARHLYDLNCYSLTKYKGQRTGSDIGDKWLSRTHQNPNQDWIGREPHHQDVPSRHYRTTFS